MLSNIELSNQVNELSTITLSLEKRINNLSSIIGIIIASNPDIFQQIQQCDNFDLDILSLYTSKKSG
ncbi:hypothetical protein CCP3SC5AM1_720020 [Gammaproteobacteria bacterium]